MSVCSPEIACSFCGASRKEVRTLVAGPTVYICDGCVALCKELIASEDSPAKAALRQNLALGASLRPWLLQVVRDHAKEARPCLSK